jgi:roadblock/LC7 domain-containing protein
MSVNLDKLMALKGAIVSGEFDKQGKLISSKGDASQRLSKLVEMLTTTNSVMKQMEIKMRAMESPHRHASEKVCLEGWALSAGGYTMYVIGNAGIFVRTDGCNFKRVVRTLSKEVGATS